MQERDNIMTVAELAKYLKVHPSTIYRLLRYRQLPAFKVGSDWRFNRERIDEWRISIEQVSADVAARRNRGGEADDE